MSVDLIDFAPEWQLHARAPEVDQRRYLAAELRRLDAERAPLLRAVLGCVDDWIQFLALGLLAENADPDGQPVIEPRIWALRLVKGATPPEVDPQGRPLPKEKRGKVLVAKVGNIGGALAPTRDALGAMGVSGEERTKAGHAGRNLYVTVEVTPQGRPFPLDQAVKILRQWGYGVVARRYLRSPGWKRGADGDPDARGQDCWLVEEVPPAAPLAKAG